MAEMPGIVQSIAAFRHFSLACRPPVPATQVQAGRAGFEFSLLPSVVQARPAANTCRWRQEDMTSTQFSRIGFWSGIVLVALGLAYLGLIATMMLSGSGYPPIEPFQTIFNALVLFTAVWMVLFWTILHQAAPKEKKLFSQASLVLIVIFATLTSINRYVGLTVVRQSISSGNTNGLQWFLPYSWPSVMLALEFLAWGFFFGLACLCLAPVFYNGKNGSIITWLLIINGILSLIATLGQVIGSSALSFNPYTFAGMIAWGPGLTTIAALIAIWFRKAKPSFE
jgi:hypothetical protein